LDGILIEIAYFSEFTACLFAANLNKFTDVTHPNDISIKIVGYENT
jgi:hypothetical protein